ncbi:MAG: sialate O-acetylesterase [Planctomycetota bacterium]
MIYRITRLSGVFTAWGLALVLVAASSAQTTSTAAGLRLGAPFTDHMVFQAEAPVRIWGWDTPGGVVTVTLAGHEAKTNADASGRWQVELPEVVEVGPYELVIAGSETITLTDVVAGEVWLCSGQSNMGWPVRSSWGQKWVLKMSPQPNLRLLKVPLTSTADPSDDIDVQWQISEPSNLEGFSAVAFFFGHDLRRNLDRPIGLIQAAWGGSKIRAWLPPETLDASPHAQRLHNAYAKNVENYEAAIAKWEAGGRAGKKPGWMGAGPQHVPSALANGMIHPLQPLSIRGVLWYQGESDAWQPRLYHDLFVDLVESWREGFGNSELPVYFVQLPNFAKGKANWAGFRNQQRLTALELPNVDMAVTIDVGKADDIHPPQKQPVGLRLARLALHHTYGRTALLPGSPRPVDVRLDPDTPGGVLVTFDRVGDGLRTGETGDPPTAFVLGDRSGTRKEAQAQIVGLDTVALTHPDVPDPVDVRYANHASPSVNLVNSEGLPATPFQIEIVGAVPSDISEPE